MFGWPCTYRYAHFSISFTLDNCSFLYTISGGNISVSSDLPLGGQWTSHWRIRHVCHEDGRTVVHTDINIRPDHCVRHGFRLVSGHLLGLPLPNSHSRCFVGHLKKTTEQVSHFIFNHSFMYLQKLKIYISIYILILILLWIHILFFWI